MTLYGIHAGKMSVHTGYFELQATTKKENVDFSRIWGFHKNVFIKPSFSDPNAPNSN